jgi:hypothetical protein
MGQITWDTNAACDCSKSTGNMKGAICYRESAMQCLDKISCVTGWRLSTAASARPEYEHGGVW